MPPELTCPLHSEVVGNIKEELKSLNDIVSKIPSLDKNITIIDGKVTAALEFHEKLDHSYEKLERLLEELDKKWTMTSISQEAHTICIQDFKERIKELEKKTDFLTVKIATWSGGLGVIIWILSKVI